jgi:hypothetical protein
MRTTVLLQQDKQKYARFFPLKILPVACSPEHSFVHVFVNRVEKEFPGCAVVSDILAIPVESLNHPRDDLLCPGGIVRFQLVEKLAILHADAVRLEPVA